MAGAVHREHMPETFNTRVTRLEEYMGRAFNAIEALADKQAKLDDVLATLTEAQIKTEERLQETGERFRETGERIDKLVSSIGELIRSRQ
jgi:anti-sigma factor ChrR (cupin superfamily)